MKHYLFYDEEFGEEFLVEARDFTEAERIADVYFVDPVFQGEILTDYEAECSGLDEY